MGLQKKIFLYAAISLIALMSLLTWISIQTNSQATEMVHQERLSLVTNIAAGMDDIIKHLKEETVESALSLGQQWQNTITDAQKTQLALTRNYLQEYPLSFQMSDRSLFVVLVDSNGKVMWTDPLMPDKIGANLDGSLAFQHIKQGSLAYTGTGDSVLTTGVSALTLAVPISDKQGKVQGVLVVDVPTSTIDNGFTYALKRQSGNYTLELVSDSNGLIIASSVNDTASVYSVHWSSVSSLAQSHSAGIVTHTRAGEEEHLVAFAPLNQIAWGVVLERPQEKTLSLPWMGERPLLVSGLILVLAGGLMWLVTRQIVRPLLRLSSTARKFGAGDLEAPIPVTGHDEIGDLAKSLDTMRGQLKHSLDEIGAWNTELEQRVKQRTSELEKLDQKLREQNKERGDLLGKIISTQEDERKRIARELHDEVGQSITSLMIGFRLLETNDPEKMRQGIANLKRLSASTLDEVRHLALELRPSSIDDLGLVAALQQYVRDYSEKFMVNADFQSSGFEGKRLRPELEIALYRIIQEALTNVAKHSEASKVSVLMSIRNESIVAIVEDNGKGFDADSLLASRTTEKKLGLYGMQERASLIGGVLTIEATPGKGTTIFLEVPLKGE